MGGGGGGVVGGVGVVCGDGVDRGVRGVDCGVVCGVVCGFVVYGGVCLGTVSDVSKRTRISLLVWCEGASLGLWWKGVRGLIVMEVEGRTLSKRHQGDQDVDAKGNGY
ncbi:hypothetical protein Tco_1311051 [Tanacetum coccineum]